MKNSHMSSRILSDNQQLKDVRVASRASSNPRGRRDHENVQIISQKRENWIFNETLENTPRSSNPELRQQFETLTENTLNTLEPYECKVRLKRDHAKIVLPKKLIKRQVTQR